MTVGWSVVCLIGTNFVFITLIIKATSQCSRNDGSMNKSRQERYLLNLAKSTELQRPTESTFQHELSCQMVQHPHCFSFWLVVWFSFVGFFGYGVKKSVFKCKLGKAAGVKINPSISEVAEEVVSGVNGALRLGKRKTF